MKTLLFLIAFLALALPAAAQIKTSQLPSGSAVSDGDLYITVQGGTTYKVTAAQIKTYIGATGYTLPPATVSLLGGVKQGAGIAIAGDGTISVAPLAFSSLTGIPTTLAGYGITDPIVLTSGSYADPAWITALAYSKLTGAPTVPAAQVNSDWSATSGIAQVLNHPVTGTQTIGSAADSVTVSGLALGFTPSFVIVTIRKTTGAYNIFATVRGSSLSSSGFTVDLSGITETNDYQLDYLIVK